MKPEVRALIDRAAKARGTTRTDFILGAAKQAAEDALSIACCALRCQSSRLGSPCETRSTAASVGIV